MTYTPYTLAEFKKVLLFPEPNVAIGTPPKFEATEGKVERDNRLTKIVSGKVQGQLIGGNLTLMVDLLGRPSSQISAAKFFFLKM